MSLPASAVTLKPNETLDPGTKRRNWTKVWSGAAVGLFFGGGGSHMPVSWLNAGDRWAFCCFSSFVVAGAFVISMEEMMHVLEKSFVWGKRGVLFLTVGLVFTFMHLADAFMLLALHSSINLIMISWVYHMSYFNTCNGWSLCFGVYFSAFIHAVTFDLLVCRLYLNVLVLFNTVSYNLKWDKDSIKCQDKVILVIWRHFNVIEI